MRDVENGHKTPEQYLGMCVYLSKLTIQKRDLLDDLFLYERTTYPFLEFSCLGEVISPKKSLPVWEVVNLKILLIIIQVSIL